MLSALILENFKAFGRRQVIPLAPITLLFGANSSGKSSILQSLLLLKQSQAHGGDSEALLTPEGDLVRLGNSNEMVFRREGSLTCEISLMLTPQGAEKSRFSAALWPLEPYAPQPIGAGLRFKFDSTRESLVLEDLPCYWGSSSRPAYRLAPVTSPLKHELAALHEGAARLARVSALDVDHAFWSDCYSRFLDPIGPNHLAMVLVLAGLSVDEVRGEPLDSRALRDVQDGLIALQGRSPQLTSLATVWANAEAFKDPGSPFMSLQELFPGLESAEIETKAREIVFKKLNLVLQLHGDDFDFGEDDVHSVDWWEGVPQFLWEAVALDQACRLIDSLILMDSIASESPELEDELSSLSIQPVVDRDRLVNDPNLEEVRALMQRRLLALTDYTLERFVEDVRTVNALRTLALRGFLPRQAPFPRLIDGDLKTVLEARYGGEKRCSWDLLPDLVQVSVLTSELLHRALERMVYLGPVREYPARRFEFNGNVPSDVGKSGGRLPDILYKQPPLIAATNERLNSFGVDYALGIRPIEPGVYGLDLMERGSGTAVSILDVGFGISQVLPIIVQSMLSKDCTILIEQPELHLHPRLQAELGTLFAESALSQGNQFIIETHSEHLILRVQRLIRDKKLKNSDVSVVYVMKGEEGSVCYPLRLDEEGDFIDDWPGGFFEEGYREMFG